MMDDDDVALPDDLLDEVEAATANRYLTNPVAGMGLIARLLAAPATVPAAAEPLARLRQLIHQEFAAIVPSCGPAGTAAARELAAIGESIEELALFPDLANKLVVGIGGGFSAGKSRFLNTLVGIDMLPEGPGPTTAIPTCLADGAAAIRAQNLINRMVSVTAEELQALEHGFDRQYKSGDGDTFGLAHLIKLLVIQQPSMRWNNLVLLDTPGYDKPDGDPHSPADEEIARHQLNQADHVVWLISARNGALRADDIRFLRSVSRRRPVFFVVTQADLQTATPLPAILRSVEEAATAGGIECAGVMGWAAPHGGRMAAIAGGNDIVEWLDALDLQPRLMDKRRSAARVMDTLSRYLEGQFASGREELTLLNAFWPVAQQLSDDTAEGIRRLLARRRENQRGFEARIARFGEFRRDLDAALKTALEVISLVDAQSEEVIERQYQEAMLALRSGHGWARDAESFTSLLDAACHEHVHAQYAVAECYRLGTGTAADPALAFSWCRKAAGQGMAEAQYMLGNCYMTGEGIAANPANALRWYQAAAEQEHLQAQMALFASHAGELEGHLDLPLAISWLKRAVRQDFAEAQFELGKCYREGFRVAKNRRTANKLFRKAAEQDYALAQHALGLACLEESDDGEAVRWFRLAAQQDLPEAQTDLAKCYLNGTGVPAHRGHAASWFRKAERLGYVPAITGLGRCHFEAEEPDLGVLCYRRAADQGDGEARFRLGECYLTGDGVRKNRSRAMHFFELAEEQGYAFPYDVTDGEAV